MDRHRLWLMWWSGLLAAAAFVHLFRAMTGVAVTVGSVRLPLWISWGIAPVAGSVSLWLVRKARGIG